MGYSANDTAQKHERILNESIRLFRERGFSGVSVDEVMKSAGLTHGPFYNHFASKEALMAETLTHEMQRFIGALDRLPATEEGKAQYADHYLSEKHMNDRGMGCAIANSCVDHHDSVHLHWIGIWRAPRRTIRAGC